MKKPFPWDWVVVIAGFMAVGLIVPSRWSVLVMSAGYALGRWDADYAYKYRRKTKP